MNTTETLYIYQTEPDGKQTAKKEKPKPFFHCEHVPESNSYLDYLANEIMLNDFADSHFFNVESNCREDLHNFAEWVGIEHELWDSPEYDTLLKIIWEWQKISFNAGFQTARELLK